MHFRPSLAVLAVTLAAAINATTPSAPAPIANVNDARILGEKSGDNWLVKGGSYWQQQFSQLKSINTGNVSRLGLTWTVDFDEPMGLTAEPIVVDGVCKAAMELGRRSLLKALPPVGAEMVADKSALQGILPNREKVRDSRADPIHDAANSDIRQPSFL